MTLPDVIPTRKQKFEAALKLAGLTVERWAREHAGVTPEHVYLVLGNRRDASAQLNAAIDAVIEKYLGIAAA